MEKKLRLFVLFFSNIIFTINAQSRCNNEPDGVKFPVANSRTSFIFCSGGAEEIRNCQFGREFNPFDRQCLASTNTNTFSTARPNASRNQCFNQEDGVMFSLEI